MKSSWFDRRAGFTSPVTGTPGVSVVVPACVASLVASGLSVAVPDISSVESAVIGGGDAATFVLVGPPPQALKTTAARTNIVNSKLIFFILLTNSFSSCDMKRCLKKIHHAD